MLLSSVVQNDPSHQGSKNIFAGIGGEQVSCFFLPQTVLYSHDEQMNILTDTENQCFVLAKAVRIKLSD